MGNTTNNSKKRKNDFLVQGSILALAGILVRLIGLAYRIPLTNKLGDAAMGIYSSAFNIYNIVLLLSSYSIPLAVSKMISSRVALKQHRDAYRTLKCSLLFATVIGLIAALITYFGAEFFATKILVMSQAVYAIRVLSPAIFIMALLGVLRGFFQGHSTMIPTAVSQLAEQIVNAIASIAAGVSLYAVGAQIDVLHNTTTEAAAYGAAGGTVGTLAGAFTALIFCTILYLAYRKKLMRQVRKDTMSVDETYGDILRMMFSILIPVILSTAIYNISSLVDNSIFGYYMKYAEQETMDYSSLWGIYSNKYTLLTNVPIAMANALASSVIPALTASVTQRNRGETLMRVNLTIRFTMIIAIPCTVGLMVLAGPIVKMIFPSDTGLAAELLILGSVAVAFFSLSTVTNAILQGINKMKVPVRNALISLILHVGVLSVLLYGFKLGVYGLVIANMLFGLTMCVLNMSCICDYLQYRQEVHKTFILPSIAGAVMGLISWGSYTLLYRLTSRNALCCLIAIAVAIVVYFVLLLLLKVVEEVELYDFPMGGRIVKLAKKMHLL